MKGWQEDKITNLCDKIFSGGTPNTKNPEFWNGEFNWLSSGETRNKFIGSTEKSITSAGVKNSSTRLALKGDLVMACAGQGHTRGQISFCLIDTYVNQSITTLRANKTLLSELFLFYCLSSRYQYLRDLSGSNSIRGSITCPMLGGIKIKYPALETQQKIATILSNYDNLIENNEKRIKILEKMAKLIYEEWFIKFRFSGHEKIKMIDGGTEFGKIPEGWNRGKLKNLYNFLPGFAYLSKDFKKDGKFGLIKIKNLDNSFVDIENVDKLDVEKEKFKLFGGDLLLAMTGAKIGKIGLIPNVSRPIYLNQRVGKFVHNNKLITNNFLIYTIAKSYLFQKYIKNISLSSSAQPNISGSQIEDYPMILPSEHILIKFNDIVEPLFELFLRLQQKNQNLRKTRDLLLPKLISGEIDVSKLEIQLNI